MVGWHNVMQSATFYAVDFHDSDSGYSALTQDDLCPESLLNPHTVEGSIGRVYCAAEEPTRGAPERRPWASHGCPAAEQPRRSGPAAKMADGPAPNSDRRRRIGIGGTVTGLELGYETAGF